MPEKLKIQPVSNIRAFIKGQLASHDPSIDPMPYFKSQIANFSRFAVGPHIWYVLDRADYQFHTVGGATELLFGLTNEEFKRMGPIQALKLIQPDDLPYHLAYLDFAWKTVYQQPVEKQKDFKISIYVRMKKQNRYVPGLMQIIDWINSPDHKTLFSLVSFTDISHVSTDKRPRLVILDNHRGHSEIFFSYAPYQETPQSVKVPNLSARQKEIVAYLAKGMSSKMIAQTLNISVNTVNNHRQNLLKATGLPNVSALVSFAFEAGIIST